MWLDEAKAALRPPEQAAPTQPPPESEPEPEIRPKNPQEVGWFHFAQNTLTMAGLDLPTIRNLEIGAGTDRNLNVVNQHYQAFSSRHPSEPYEPKVPRARSSLSRNKRSRKRVLLRKLQRKWKHNRSEACSEAVAGKWDQSKDPGTTTHRMNPWTWKLWKRSGDRSSRKSLSQIPGHQRRLGTQTGTW